MPPPVLVFHVCAGIVALLSGTAAMSFRKGSRRHRQTGNVFVVSMLALGASGAYIGFSKHQTLNAMVGGVLATYGVAAANSPTRSLGHYPAAAYFVFGSLALFFAAGDVRMLAHGGVSGTQRIARHLGRMCFGLFIATGSFFLGREQIFWLIRVRRYSWSFRESYRSAAESISLPTT
jgi:hypothetical protein